MVAVALLGLGCSDDFDPDWRLGKARVLAVQADPPQPSFGSSTTLRALLYLPTQETPSYHWSWCPAPTSADDGFACPIDQAGFDKLLGLGPDQAPSLDLGAGETATLTNLFAPEVLAALCAGRADALLTDGMAGDGGTGASAAGSAGVGPWTCASAGFPVTVRMEFRTPSMGQSAVSAFKVFLPTDASLPGNENPAPGGLAVIEPASAPLSQPLDDAGSVSLARKLKNQLRLDLNASVSETFRGWTRDELGGYRFDASGNHVIGEVREIVALKWYVEGGELGDGNVNDAGDTGYNPYTADPKPFSAALEMDWKTPKQADYARDRARIVVVVRDDRGGVGWTQATVGLEPQP